MGSSKLAYNSKAKAGGFNLVMDNKRVIQRLQLRATATIAPSNTSARGASGRMRAREGRRFIFLSNVLKAVIWEIEAAHRFRARSDARPSAQAHPVRLRGETKRTHRTYAEAFCQTISEVFLHGVVHDVLGLDDIARH